VAVNSENMRHVKDEQIILRNSYLTNQMIISVLNLEINNFVTSFLDNLE